MKNWNHVEKELAQVIQSNGLATEVIAQAKKDVRCWKIIWAITVVIAVAAWILK